MHRDCIVCCDCVWSPSVYVCTVYMHCICTEMYFMAITGNVIAIRVLNFNLTGMLSNGSNVEKNTHTNTESTTTLDYGEQTMAALLICSKSDSNYECPLH